MPRVQVREVLRGGGGDATLEIIADLLQEAEDMPVLMVHSLLTPAATVATKLLTPTQTPFASQEEHAILSLEYSIRSTAVRLNKLLDSCARIESVRTCLRDLDRIRASASPGQRRQVSVWRNLVALDDLVADSSLPTHSCTSLTRRPVHGGQ